MKNNLFRISLALLLTTLSSTAIAQTTPQVFDIPLSRPGETVNLEISVLSAHIEVIGELDAGDQVVTRGAERLSSGMEVSLTVAAAN